MSEHFDRKNRPISGEEWAKLYTNKDYCHIKTTRIDNGTLITTSWIGIAIKYGPTGPMIYATIVQELDGDTLIHEYATEQMALEHHRHLADTYYDDQEPISRWRQIADELGET